MVILAVVLTVRLLAGMTVAVGPMSWIPPPPDDLSLIASKLREHCRSCHGLGSQRFIYDESDMALWVRLYTLSAPVSGELWAERIARVLDWPTDAPPPFEQFMEPPDRDWMPKGAGRLHLATDTIEGQVEGQLVRHLIVTRLRGGLAK